MPAADGSRMKAAIYCRLSEEDRNKATDTDDSHSIQNQKAMLLRYAAELTPGPIAFELVSDEMRETALSEKKDDIYLAQETAWLEEQEIVMLNLDALIEKVEVEPAAEAELIFASVNADTHRAAIMMARKLFELKWPFLSPFSFHYSGNGRIIPVILLI